jgi:hypothetical protein
MWMVTADAPFQLDGRVTVYGTFQSVRTMTVEVTTVRRLLFHTEQYDRLPVLVTDTFGLANDLRTGQRYRLEEVLVYRTVGPTDSLSESADLEHWTSSDPARALITGWLAQVNVDETFGVLDGQSRLQPADSA